MNLISSSVNSVRPSESIAAMRPVSSFEYAKSLLPEFVQLDRFGLHWSDVSITGTNFFHVFSSCSLKFRTAVINPSGSFALFVSLLKGTGGINRSILIMVESRGAEYDQAMVVPQFVV
jgi:hypothetical protein